MKALRRQKHALSQSTTPSHAPYLLHSQFTNWGRKKHINFFNINILAPTQNPPFWAPQKSLCASFPWKECHKGDPHKLFLGILGGQKGGPKRSIFGHKEFSLLFFLPLKGLSRTSSSLPRPKFVNLTFCSLVCWNHPQVYHDIFAEVPGSGVAGFTPKCLGRIMRRVDTRAGSGRDSRRGAGTHLTHMGMLGVVLPHFLSVSLSCMIVLYDLLKAD